MSELIEEYRKLADKIFSNNKYVIPEPLNDEDFEDFFKQFI